MYKFKFADVGEGIHEAVLSDWYVKEGDRIEEGKEIYAVETDKFTTDVTSPVSGVIKKIYYEVGSDILVGDLLVDIDDGSADTEEPSEKTEESASISEGASVVGSIKVSEEIIESYVEEKEEGPDHDKTFFVALKLDDEMVSFGQGKTKKEAEQKAAMVALERGLY